MLRYKSLIQLKRDLPFQTEVYAVRTYHYNYIDTSDIPCIIV